MGMQDSVSHIGCDCHRKFSMLTARDKENTILWRQRLDHKNREALGQSLRTLPPGTPVVLESSFGWGWMSDELTAAALTPRLAHTRKIAGWRAVRGLAKSNRLDSDLLSELPLQTPPWWEVWLPPPEVRQQREWMRHRMSLVKLQTAMKNRIHAVLHRHGVLHDFADLFGAQGRRFLNLLASKQPPAGTIVLPASARAVIKDTLQLLDHVRRQIARITRELRCQVRRSPAGERLRTIPGIGWVLAYTILAEIGDIRRFRDAKRLASYSLLAPMARDSGEEDPDAIPVGRHVGFIGRRTLKWAFIEASHTSVRCGGRFRDLYDRRTACGKKDRNRGLIVVAHELCRLVYVLWSKGVEYTKTPPARPGARPLSSSSCSSLSSSSRSVKGQPDLAMVVAE